MSKRPMIGLALGGGGARGIAHIGVLKVLERENIPIDFIVGSSIGALVGAAYAINPDAAALAKRVADVLGEEGRSSQGFKLLGKIQRYEQAQSNLIHRLVRFAEKEMFLNLVLVRKALLSEKESRQCVEPFLSDIDLAETSIPCVVTAVDLTSGRKVVLKLGSVIQAVMASCAVPGFMPPIPWNEMLLVDGGVLDVVPASPAKEEGAKVIIGVDVGASLCLSPAIGDGIDAINRVAEIMQFYLSRPGRELADLLIEPDVKEIHWTDFLKYDELIKRGEQAAMTKIDEIRKTVHRAHRKINLRWPAKLFADLYPKKFNQTLSNRLKGWLRPERQQADCQEQIDTSSNEEPAAC